MAGVQHKVRAEGGAEAGRGGGGAGGGGAEDGAGQRVGQRRGGGGRGGGSRGQGGAETNPCCYKGTSDCRAQITPVTTHMHCGWCGVDDESWGLC